jgi:anti-sigma-K factor RskA
MAERDAASPHVDVAGYLLETLTPAERASFEAHLATCPACQHELEELRGLPGLLSEAPEPVEVPAALRARVLDAVAEEPARPPARPAPVIRLDRPRSRPWWRPVLAPVAAAALAAAFLGGLLVGRVATPGPQPGPAPGPVVQTIHLAAAGGGTGSGTAVVRDTEGGRSIELTVRGLPPPSADHYYTCWLVADDDTPQHQDRVSVGSFTTTGQGPLTVRWETAADLARYPHLGVTLEPANGNPLKQGPKVLAGP